MPALRKVEIDAILDDEPRSCATCPTILEEHKEITAGICAAYWRDVDNGLFDDPVDWPKWCGQERSWKWH